MVYKIYNEILKSPLPTYLDIKEENFFYKDIDNVFVIIRGSIFSEVEKDYINSYFENNKDINRLILDIKIQDNKIKIYLLSN